MSNLNISSSDRVFLENLVAEDANSQVCGFWHEGNLITGREKSQLINVPITVEESEKFKSLANDRVLNRPLCSRTKRSVSLGCAHNGHRTSVTLAKVINACDGLDDKTSLLEEVDSFPFTLQTLDQEARHLKRDDLEDFGSEQRSQEEINLAQKKIIERMQSIGGVVLCHLNQKT